jgi:hypothetical protein
LANLSGKNDVKMVFHPENCLDCLLSERVGMAYQCRFYCRSYMPLRGEKPSYCRVINIKVEEESVKDTYAKR